MTLTVSVLLLAIGMTLREIAHVWMVLFTKREDALHLHRERRQMFTKDYR